jgi:hypothetical protein
MNHAEALELLMRSDQERQRILAIVHALNLPDCWIAAGFVRNAVWDFLHDLSPSLPSGDVDVIWFDPARSEPCIDLRLEQRLTRLDGSVAWSVKNQSRMHTRNGDRPYHSASDAMTFWPETATATAIRHGAGGELDIAEPFCLDDLFGAVIRPTARFESEKRGVFDARFKSKQWREQWPLLRVVES